MGKCWELMKSEGEDALLAVGLLLGEIKVERASCLLLSSRRASHVMNKVWASVPRVWPVRYVHVIHVMSKYTTQIRASPPLLPFATRTRISREII